MSLKDVGRHVHILSEIDPEARTAVCANCGPTTLKSKGPGKWACRKSWKSYQTKNKHRASKQGLCERCGFKPKHRCQLDVHHRDHDHSNNDPANLETLCANCHRLEHVSEPFVV